MKICSLCQLCYDDSITNCVLTDHGVLFQANEDESALEEGYRIISKIESVSPVELYRAAHLSSNRNVLIRFFRAESDSGELLDELQTLASIEHPNLARVFDFVELENHEFYVVLEAAGGRNLKEYLANTPKISETKAIGIARQIAEGLEYLHRRGILYRGINPANIFLTDTEQRNPNVKLHNYDFGRINERRVLQTIRDTAAYDGVWRYFSPEQLAETRIDFKSDLYSLAVVFYEMLLGRPPYAEITPEAIAEYVFNEDDTDVLNHELRALIAYTLRESFQRKLEFRPRTTNNLVRQLRHLELVAASVDETKTESSDVYIIPDQGRDELPAEKSSGQKTTPEPNRYQHPVSPTERVEVSAASSLDSQNAILDLTMLDDSVSDNSLTVDGSGESVSQIIKYKQVSLSEYQKKLDEIYSLTTRENASPDLQSDYPEYVEKAKYDERSFSRKPFEKRVNSLTGLTAANSYTFKKSHVYIAGVLEILLIGSFFFVTFYDWRSDAASPKIGLPDTPAAAVKPEKTARQLNNVRAISAEREDKTEDLLAEPLQPVRSLPEQIKKKPVYPAEKNAGSKTKRIIPPAAKIEGSGIGEEPAESSAGEKKLFEKKVIIIGDEQNAAQQQDKQGKKKQSAKRPRAFSDVVIYY